MKKPEEYLKRASTFTSYLGTIGLTIENVLALISRVQRDAVEACIDACEKRQSDYDRYATEADESRHSLEAINMEQRCKGAKACAGDLAALLPKEPA